MSFRSNVVTMLTGTVVAQAIPIVIAPLLARLYSPDAFGLQTLVMGLAAICVVPATLRLDLAMILPPTDREAKVVAAIILCVTAAMALVFLFAAALWADEIALRLGHPAEPIWIWILPLLTISIVIFQILSAFASRSRNFRPVATGNVVNQIGYALAAIALGFSGGGWAPGLAVAKLAGQAAGTVSLLRVHGGAIISIRSHFSVREMIVVAKRYWQFLVFNTPYSLIGSISREAPILIFSSMGAVSAAGFYGMARTIVLAPTLLISNALSQVYYREAVALRGTPRLHEMTVTLVRVGLLVTAAPFAFCAAWGNEFFAVVFGSIWRDAGSFAMVLAPAAWLSTQTGWPERLFEVNGRQGVSFTIQIVADAAVAMALVFVFATSSSPIWAIAVYAICNVIYQLVYLFAIFRVSAFPAAKLIAALGWSVFAFGLFYLLFLGIKGVGGPGLFAGAVSIVAAAVAALATAWKCRKDVLAFT
jgi:O-antigen/teichoic acid export membrane protein